VPQFNPFRPAYLADPYPFLHRLREQAPVHRSADVGAWVVTTYADGLAVLQDDANFSSDPAKPASPLGEQVRATRQAAPLGHAPLLGNSDPPEHDRLRAIVNRAFTPRAVESFRPQVMEIVESALAPLHAGEPREVMAGIADLLTVVGSLNFLGIPTGEMPRFRAIAGAVLRCRTGEAAQPGVLSEGFAAAQVLTAYLHDLGPAPAEVRPDSVLATLLAAVDARQLTIDEAAMLIIHISSSGNGPTSMAIGNIIRALAEHPDQFDRLRAEPGLALATVEEGLRFDSPTHIVNRFALAPTSLRGKRVAKDDTVQVVIGAANRDPAVFDDPDRFDIARPAIRNLSFGVGIHVCLGAPLARLELESLVTVLSHRFRTLEIDHSALEMGGTLLVRGPRRLVITPR
jgi:hypothetical protein